MAKQFIMYSNDSVEATFADGTKIYLAPCATEYVVQQGTHTQGKFNFSVFLKIYSIILRHSHDKTPYGLYN